MCVHVFTCVIHRYVCVYVYMCDSQVCMCVHVFTCVIHRYVCVCMCLHV